MSTDAPERLDRRLARLARDLRGGEVACLAAAPTVRGDLALVLDVAGRQARVVVSVRPRAGTAAVRMGDLHVLPGGGGGGDAGGEPAVLQAVRERLAEARARGGAEWLDLHSRECRDIPRSAPDLLRLMLWQVAPDRPFWAGWRLESTEAVGAGDGIRVRLSLTDGDERVALALDETNRPGPGEEPLAATPLGLLLRESPRPGAASLPLARQPERALALVLALSLHGGMRWVGRAPGAGSPVPVPGPEPVPVPVPAPQPEPVPEAPAPSDPDPAADAVEMVNHCFTTAYPWGERTSDFFATWGGRDFFNVVALFGDEACLVFHGNRECPMARSTFGTSIMQGSGPYGDPGPWSPAIRTVVTDTDDRSVVFGGEARLEAAVRETSELHPGSPIRVTLGCDYAIVGDDAIGVCRGLADCGVPVEVLNPPLPRFTESLARSWWRHYLREARDAAVERDPAAVALAGFGWPHQRGIRELVDLLGEAGVRVATTFCPGRESGFRTRVGEAATVVASPWAPIETVLVPILGDLGFAVESFPAPYGENATRRWVDAVCRSVGRPVPDDVAWAETSRRLAPDLPRLRERAGGVSVGLIADVGSAAEMCSPRFFFGFDPVLLLLDSGFRVTVLGNKADRAAEAYAGLPADLAERLSFVKEDLRAGPGTSESIRRLGLDLVYCDKAEGAAAKAGGAVPFAIRHLEPGLAGAERTAARLVAMSRQRLYRAYPRHFRGGAGEG